MGQQLVGPPARGNNRGEVTNPADIGWVDVVIHLVPYLHGGAIGIVEGLARAGRFETWRNLSDYIKGTILGVIGGVAEYFEETQRSSSPQIARAMCKLSGAATSHGVAYAVAAGIGGESGKMMPAAENWKFNPLTAESLSGLSMSGEDSAAAMAAVQEMLARRDEITHDGRVGELVIGGDPLGELAFPDMPHGDRIDLGG